MVLVAVDDEVHARTGGALVISNRPPDHDDYRRGERAERCASADGDDVVCFRPQPHATRGEARAIGKLAAEARLATGGGGN